MGQFDIANFTVDSEPAKEEITQYPSWVTTATDSSKRVYNLIVAHAKKIEQKISEEMDLAIKDRKLVARTILSEAGLDPSYISQPAQKLLKEYLNSENDRLSSLWSRKHNRKKQSGKKLLKSEIESKYRELKKLYKIECDKNYRAFAEDVLNSKFLEAHESLARKNKELIKEVEELRASRANLQQELARLQLKVVK